MHPPAHAELHLLPGARRLLELHAAELPQRDDLCGAFCGALALRVAGIESSSSDELDQDAVALAAGSVISAVADPSILPRGERGRRDYRLALPSVQDITRSGTTAEGLVRGLRELAGPALAVLPYAGPWSEEALEGIFETALSLERPVTLIANLATRYLWGSHPAPGVLLDYLGAGIDSGPAPDWDVGHFACVVARARGPAGSLYALADTYRSLGHDGVHVQPLPRLALSLRRPDLDPGGLIVVAHARDAATVRERAAALGLAEELWDNGSVTAERAA